ncbi:MAG: hypothetical protein LUH54_00145 [Firmicutes bacterium]|nr:hypothetical protein [Bacillota bacterium]
MTLTYMYENFIPAIANSNAQEIYYREYKAYNLRSGSFLISFDEDYDFYSVLESLDESEIFSNLSLISKYNDAEIYGLYSGTPHVVIEAGTSVLASDYEIIVPCNDSTSVGNTVNIVGTEFTVVGRHTFDDIYYITYSAIRSLDTDISYVYGVSAERQDFSDDEAAAALYEVMPGINVETPEIYELADEMLSGQYMILICGCYAVSVVSFMFLLCYIIESCMDENIVSMIVGAPKSDIFVMVFWEGLPLTSFANALGMVLHAALYDVFFAKINITGAGISAGDYLTLFLAMFVISVVVVFAFLFRYMKLSPTASRLADER